MRGRKLTEDDRRARARAKVEDQESREILRDAKRRERAANEYSSASSIGKRMLSETPDQREARKYRRRHLRKEWLFAKKAKNHKGLLNDRRDARRATMIGRGYENDNDQAGYERLSTEDIKTETETAPRKRLYARDLL